MPGSCHDAFVLENSGIFTQSNSLPQAPIDINGTLLPLVIFGDAAYPNLHWLMKPYTGALTQQQISFNNYHSRSRVIIENYFGILKARWRILKNAVPVSLEFVPHIVAACCILHNILENDQTPVVIDDCESAMQEPSQNDRRDAVADQTRGIEQRDNEMEVAIADQTRDALCTYLWENFPHLLQTRF
uniref:protein ALP1-like n=1 Tax=Styela clava TaxID=7725 RepID=UPI00193A1B28|nr:protein ALP1-like [Styela clava]XP_039272415.1 protein ALP1-like [Styela clava]